MLNYNTEANHKELNVIYEDTHVIAVNKPSGLLVQGDYSKEITLIDIVRKYLAVKYNKSGNVYLGLVHRLDKPACGIVIFGKTSKGASRLSKQFREHQITKVYNAMVEGEVKEGTTGNIKSYLIRDKDITKQAPDKSSGQYAELNWEYLGKYGKNRSLIKVNLLTGRKHQIRFQLSNAGFPIVGDNKYGAKTFLSDRNSIALISKELHFYHVTEKNLIKLCVDIPKYWF